MSHTPHTLAEELPEYAEAMVALKHSDAHFARLAERYAELNEEIYRIEAELTPASDETAETLKKQRLALLDEIAEYLNKAA
ncbi:DUF465 domain-containing protein [Phreatobacter aquaticus]|uniref:DUF465 domain-containing protein n=1 Tax=Phreatobacter aquaticus TaxID=2570229 RepID=A0A4D7QNT3_9HYPH|nr:YdcH family protein [Phreatobacter aquaticus]QCK86637.1 DUF465 domain-containing protein [Phreatobacter aquaticus]